MGRLLTQHSLGHSNLHPCFTLCHYCLFNGVFLELFFSCQILADYITNWSIANFLYVSHRLRVQNRRKKWNFPLNFRTMHKLSDLYSGIFQTQSSGCASRVDLFRNFTKLKILNIWIVKYLLNCKRYLSYNFRIFQKISECWVLENLDVHLERTTSELEFWNFQHAFYSFQNILKFQHDFLQFSEHWKFQHAFL